MTTVFSKIISGELPGRFVYQDPDVVAFLSIAPLSDGHTLVVPRQEVDRWTDVSAELLNKLMNVAQRIGAAQVKAFNSSRAGLSIVGFEVEHLHIHVWPVNGIEDYDWDTVQQNVDPDLLEKNAAKIIAALE